MPATTMTARTCGTAITSLVLGILAVILGFFSLGILGFPLGLIAAIIGHVGMGKVKRSEGQLGGKGLAVAGVIMGWITAGVSALFLIPIFAIISIPAYQNYVTRSQISEGPSLANGAKTAVAEYYTSHDTWPANNADAGLSAARDISGSHVRQVAVKRGGTIAITYSDSAREDIAGRVLTLSPHADDSGAISWNCASPSDLPADKVIDNKYLPQNCR